MSLDGHRDDNTVVTGTTTADSPVQVGVLGARSSDNLAGGIDNLHGQGVVSTKAELGAQGRVATTLGVTTGQTNSWAFTTDDDKALGSSSLEDLVAQNTGTDREGGALVVSIREIGVFDVIEVVGPDRQSTSTGRTTQVAVYRVSSGSSCQRLREKLTHDQCS